MAIVGKEEKINSEKSPTGSDRQGPVEVGGMVVSRRAAWNWLDGFTTHMTRREMTLTV